jgi:hypothetical protein
VSTIVLNCGFKVWQQSWGAKGKGGFQMLMERGGSAVGMTCVTFQVSLVKVYGAVDVTVTILFFKREKQSFKGL